MPLSMLLVLLLQADLGELVDRLDAAAPDARDAAEEALKGRLTADARRLAAYADDPRAEVRVRVRRLLASASPEALLPALFHGHPKESSGAAWALASLPWTYPEDEAWVEVCAAHATPLEVALQVAQRIPVVLLDAGWTLDVRLKPFRGFLPPTQVAMTDLPDGLAWDLRHGTLGLGSPQDHRTWGAGPPMEPAFRDLVHRDPRRRELAGRSVGRLADVAFLRALGAVDHPHAREALVWSLVDRLHRHRVDPPELAKPLEQVLAGPPGPLAAAACAAFRELPFGPNPALLSHENRETRYLALLAMRGWHTAIRGRLDDPEAEIRLAAYRTTLTFVPPAELPWPDLLRVFRSLPDALAEKVWSVNPDRFPVVQDALQALLGSESLRERRLALVSLLSSKRAELIEAALARVERETDPALLSAVVAAARFPAVRDREAGLDFLERRARAGDAAAVHPLGQSEVPKALEILVRLADHEKKEIRREVVNGLWIWQRRGDGEPARRTLEKRRTAETDAEVKALVEKALAPPAGGGGFKGKGLISCPVCDGLPTGVRLERPSFASPWR